MCTYVYIYRYIYIHTYIGVGAVPRRDHKAGEDEDHVHHQVEALLIIFIYGSIFV